VKVYRNFFSLWVFAAAIAFAVRLSAAPAAETEAPAGGLGPLAPAGEGNPAAGLTDGLTETPAPLAGESRESAKDGGEASVAHIREMRFFLTIPDVVDQGGTLPVLLRGATGLQAIEAQFSDASGKKIFSFSGFRVSGPGPGSAPGSEEGESSDEYWAALGGISSVQQPGVYDFALSLFFNEAQTLVVNRKIRVEKRTFVFENIPLNKAMSELRATPNARRDAEARELLALLSKSDTSAVYHTAAFCLPVAEGFRETSFFGDRRTFLYTDGKKASSIHYGIDYATPRGTAVYASGEGRVALAKDRVITGFSIVIEHLPGVYSLYYHLDRIDVEPGQRVRSGEKIGESGFTGLATGPHMHWELRVSGNAIEPKNLVKAPLIDTNELFGIIKKDKEPVETAAAN
jgi:murein DD-endopeptidase MepM/ murein hydrolase activator NlpD